MKSCRDCKKYYNNNKCKKPDIAMSDETEAHFCKEYDNISETEIINLIKKNW